MKINYKYFPEVIPDNEQIFIAKLIGTIESVDELCCLQISKLPTSYHFRIAPSIPKYNNLLLQEVLNFHNLFGIKLDLSKSIKTSGVLAFHINLS